jgi:hypothetical protein
MVLLSSGQTLVMEIREYRNTDTSKENETSNEDNGYSDQGVELQGYQIISPRVLEMYHETKGMVFVDKGSLEKFVNMQELIRVSRSRCELLTTRGTGSCPLISKPIGSHA